MVISFDVKMTGVKSKRNSVATEVIKRNRVIVAKRYLKFE